MVISRIYGLCEAPRFSNSTKLINLKSLIEYISLTMSIFVAVHVSLKSRSTVGFWDDCDFNKTTLRAFSYSLFSDPIPPHLSNVGSDLCRGMLTFADAKPLGKRGLFWLKVHLANFAGQDKMSFDDRAQFIDENIDNVRRSVDEPFGDNPWWKTLDDPFQGMALMVHQ